MGVAHGGLRGVADQDSEPLRGVRLQEPYVVLPGGISVFNLKISDIDMNMIIVVGKALDGTM